MLFYLHEQQGVVLFISFKHISSRVNFKCYRQKGV